MFPGEGGARFSLDVDSEKKINNILNAETDWAIQFSEI